MTESTLVLAALAGPASFVSPCMLPVIPAFLAQLAGTSLGHSDLERGDVLRGTVLFVIGLSAVFATLGVALGTVLESAATDVLAWLSRLAGEIVILLGLHLTGLLRLPMLDRYNSARPTTLQPLTWLRFSSARRSRSPGRRASGRSSAVRWPSPRPGRPQPSRCCSPTPLGSGRRFCSSASSPRGPSCSSNGIVGPRRASTSLSGMS